MRRLTSQAAVCNWEALRADSDNNKVLVVLAVVIWEQRLVR